MSWKGTMSCEVTNKTGGPIAVYVEHVLGNHTDKLTFRMLNNNAVAEFTINVGSGSNDLWTVRLMASHGGYAYRDGKQCNVEEDDLNSNQPVNLYLYNTKEGFTVALPSSSSCDKNYYNTCP